MYVQWLLYVIYSKCMALCRVTADNVLLLTKPTEISHRCNNMAPKAIELHLHETSLFV